MDPESAVRDFHARRENYKRVYEPISERDGPFVKIINSKQFIVNAIRGYLPLKVGYTFIYIYALGINVCPYWSGPRHLSLTTYFTSPHIHAYRSFILS